MLNDHMIIQGADPYLGTGGRIFHTATEARHQGRSDVKQTVTYIYARWLCGAPGRPRRITPRAKKTPGRIASASPTSSCPPLRGRSHTVPLHCITGETPAGPRAGCISHLVMQACVWKKEKRGRSAFVIVLKRHKNSPLSCTLCFSGKHWEGQQMSLHHICPAAKTHNVS